MPKTYQEAKKQGVVLVTNLLSSGEVTANQTASEAWRVSRKKDDLADCLLQAITYLNKQ